MVVNIFRLHHNMEKFFQREKNLLTYYYKKKRINYFPGLLWYKNIKLFENMEELIFLKYILKDPFKIYYTYYIYILKMKFIDLLKSYCLGFSIGAIYFLQGEAFLYFVFMNLIIFVGFRYQNSLSISSLGRLVSL